MNLRLVCTGGGARGRWQAGALYALHEMGWVARAGGFIGTSAGGLNVCALAAGLIEGKGADLLKASWDAISRNLDVFQPQIPKSPWEFLNPVEQGIWAARLVSYFAGTSLLDNTALQTLCRRVLGQHTSDELEVLTGKTVRTRAFGYKSGMVESLQGLLSNMALATSAIEGIFPAWDPTTSAPATNGAKEGYGDGGLLDNAPIDEAVAQGADYVIMVYTGPENDPADPGHQFTGFNNDVRALNRAVTNNEEVASAAAEAKLPAGHVLHLYPNYQTGDILDFSNTDMFKKGYDFAKAFMPGEVARLGWPDPEPDPVQPPDPGPAG